MLSQEDTDEQQLHLRWNNHTNNLVEIFREQFCKQNLVDVTLSCQGKQFKAHRMVLSACSPYFQDLFDSHDTPHPIIILNNMNQAHVKNLLEFMYKGEIKVLESELESFLQIAEVLQVKGLCNIRSKETKRQLTDNHENEPRPKIPKMSDEGSSQAFIGENDFSDRLDSSNNDDSFEAISPSALVKKESKVPPVVRVQVGDSSIADKGDNDLASLIKVEPPDIRDIDGGSIDDGEGPRVIIDLPVVTDNNVTTITTTTIRPAKGSNETKLKQRTKPFAKAGRPRKERELCEEVAKIRRPPNAFMIFANEWRRKLASENPTESNKAISIRLGVMWKSMDPTEKEAYYNAAKQADLEHKQKYPGYYYSPKEAREALLRKKLTKKKSCFEATQLVRVLMPVGDDDQDELDDQVPFS